MFDLKVTKTSTAKLVNKAIEEIAKQQVYVGIPSKNASRPGEEINNAELMYIHTNGSPIRNIPSRPVIEPAIQASPNKEMIADQLGAAADAALLGDRAAMGQHLVKAGILGANAAKAWFTDPRNNWPPNRPSTIRNKLRTLKGKDLKHALEILDEYEDDPTTDVSEIDTPLIDTGEMRRAITYVVGEENT